MKFRARQVVTFTEPGNIAIKWRISYKILTYRLDIDDLFSELQAWDNQLRQSVLLVACGGTALTLKGYKESTKDGDFLVPDPANYSEIIRVIKALGYADASGHGYAHPNRRWTFDLYRGQRVFQTDLLDPLQEPDRHDVVKTLNKLVVATLKPDDLVISKMFRGTAVDVQDCVTLIKAEAVDLESLIDRYIETAGYYYNPSACKTTLSYLVQALEEEKISCDAIKEVITKWNP